MCSISIAAMAQCKNVVKKNLPKLAPFTHNGQLNSANVKSGGTVKFQISCYTGLTYRVAVCGEDELGKLTFRVVDENNKEVFNSASNNNASSWDFNVGSSQELTVEVSAPANPKSISGCAALLVGFSEPSNNGGGGMRRM